MSDFNKQYGQQMDIFVIGKFTDHLREVVDGLNQFNEGAIPHKIMIIGHIPDSSYFYIAESNAVLLADDSETMDKFYSISRKTQLYPDVSLISLINSAI